MPTFKRDSFTWLAYFMLAFYAYMQSSLGPLKTFLIEELNLNFTVAGFHLSVFALGMALAGVTTDKLEIRFGRRFVFMAGGTGMVIGALLLIAGRSEYMTIFGAFVMGYIGSWLLIMINASLTDHHGILAGIAITESNVIASIGSMITPILIGVLAVTDVGWRGALITGALMWGVLVLFFQRVNIPQKRSPIVTQKGINGTLPPAFWAYWVLIMFNISIEWSVIFWATDFLHLEIGLSPIDASRALSLFFLGNIISRTIFSQLARRYPSRLLLFGAVIISIIGFPIFWLAQMPLLNVIGLFITGLGVGSLFPLNLASATTIAADRANVASARVSLATGIAMLVTPQVLASVADITGLFPAYSIVLVLLIGALITTFIANRLATRQLEVVTA